MTTRSATGALVHTKFVFRSQLQWILPRPPWSQLAGTLSLQRLPFRFHVAYSSTSPFDDYNENNSKDDSSSQISKTSEKWLGTDVEEQYLGISNGQQISPVKPRPQNHKGGSKIFRPHGKFRSKKGKLVLEQEADLEIKSLGRSSKVLILRDVTLGDESAINVDDGLGNNGDILRETSPSGEDVDSHDTLFKSVEHHPQRLEGTDLFRAIVQLKPPGSPLLAESAFEEKAEQIDDSFTTNQLLQYLQSNEKHINSSPLADDRLKSAAPKIIQDWEPVQNPLHRLEANSPETDTRPIEEPKSEPRTGFKRALIHQIMTELWGLGSETDFSVSGTLVIQLAEDDLGMLRSGAPHSQLNYIAKSKFAEVSVIGNKDIKITADKPAAEAVVRDIQMILQNSSRLKLTFPRLVTVEGKSAKKSHKQANALKGRVLSGFLPQFKDINKRKKMFQEISDRFKVSLRENAHGVTLKGCTKASLFDAKRALTTILYQGLPQHTGRVMVPQAVLSNGDFHQGAFTLPDMLPYPLRSSKLCRVVQGTKRLSGEPRQTQQRTELAETAKAITSPATSRVEDSMDSTMEHPSMPLLLENEKKQVLDFLLQEPKQSFTSRLWDSNPTTEVHCSPGYCLHSMIPPKDRAFLFPSIPFTDSTVQKPSYWVSIVPGLRRVLTYLSRSPTRMESSIRPPDSAIMVNDVSQPATVVERQVIFKLVPHIWSMRTFHPDKHPHIEMVLTIPQYNMEHMERSGPYLSSFSIVAKSHSLDLLMPSSSTDIRFAKRILYTLPPEKISESVALSQFVNATISMVEKGDNRAPETVKIPLPRWVISNVSNKEHTGSEEIETEYFFCSATVQETVHSFIHDHPVSCTLSVGGSLTEHTTQLRLHFENPSPHIQASDVGRDRFLTAALALNDTVNLAATGRLAILSVKEDLVSALSKHELKDLVGEDAGAIATGSMTVKEVLAESGPSTLLESSFERNDGQSDPERAGHNLFDVDTDASEHDALEDGRIKTDLQESGEYDTFVNEGNVNLAEGKNGPQNDGSEGNSTAKKVH